MWLDDLEQLVEVLKLRAVRFGPSLRQNETRTRYALIDPLLQALGWDVSDPAVVTPEFATGEGRPDYALHAGSGDGPASLFLEAKRLGTSLDDKLGQVITYCNDQGVKYCVVTDGIRWGAYEVFRPVPTPKKLIVELKLTDPSHETVLKLLWLWKRNFVGGLPVTPQAPARPGPGADIDNPSVIKKPITVEKHMQARDWVSLASWEPKSFDLPPRAIRFPDGKTYPLSRWFELQMRIVEWLVSVGRLRAEDCPVTTPRGTYLVHTEGSRKNGEAFFEPKNVAGLWIDAHYSTEDHIRLSRTILKARGVKLEEVGLRRAAP